MRKLCTCLFYGLCVFTIVFSLFWMALPKLSLPVPDPGSEALFHQSAQNCTQYHIIARAQNAGKNQSSALIGLIICSITQSAGQSTAFPCEN